MAAAPDCTSSKGKGKKDDLTDIVLSRCHDCWGEPRAFIVCLAFASSGLRPTLARAGRRKRRRKRRSKERFRLASIGRWCKHCRENSYGLSVSRHIN
eukprot:4663042-Amphidinium_carterae.1